MLFAGEYSSYLLLVIIAIVNVRCGSRRNGPLKLAQDAGKQCDVTVGQLVPYVVIIKLTEFPHIQIVRSQDWETGLCCDNFEIASAMTHQLD